MALRGLEESTIKSMGRRKKDLKGQKKPDKVKGLTFQVENPLPQELLGKIEKEEKGGGEREGGGNRGTRRPSHLGAREKRRSTVEPGYRGKRRCR